MAKKIIVVNAGPRKGWNTDTLLTEAGHGAEAEGGDDDEGRHKERNKDKHRNNAGVARGPELLLLLQDSLSAEIHDPIISERKCFGEKPP